MKTRLLKRLRRDADRLYYIKIITFPYGKTTRYEVRCRYPIDTLILWTYNHDLASSSLQDFKRGYISTEVNFMKLEKKS